MRVVEQLPRLKRVTARLGSAGLASRLVNYGGALGRRRKLTSITLRPASFFTSGRCMVSGATCVELRPAQQQATILEKGSYVQILKLQSLG